MSDVQQSDNFRYVEPRIDTLLEGYDGTWCSQEYFIQGRHAVLLYMEQDIVNAFQARKELVMRFRQSGGMDEFKAKWSGLVHESPKNVSAALSIAAFETTKGIEKLYDLKNLICAVRFGRDPEKEKLKWPVMPTLFPELSAWLLSPVQERTSQFFQVLDDMCPDINSKDEETSLKIYWEQADLFRREEEQSMYIYIRGKKIRSELSMYSSFRIYALSKFVSVVYDQVMNKTKCESCSKFTEPLKSCARCHCVYYCSRQCQKNHFSDHKKVCKVILKELYERYSSGSIKTDFMSLRMSTEAYLFPKLKEKVLMPLATFAEAEGERMFNEDPKGSQIIGTHSFKPQL